MEDYEKAAESRLNDWNALCDKNRKVGIIHMGGIYIECLLKAIICCKHTVALGSKPSKWKVDGLPDEVTRPSHDLKAQGYVTLLPDLYDDMSPDVEAALEYISEPYNMSYIDYRYIEDDLVSEEKFDTWMLHFIELYNYLREQMSEL